MKLLFVTMCCFQVSRNSVSIHDEYVVHGSNGNNSPNTRRTYVIAFRAKDTVIRERAAVCVCIMLFAL